MTQLFRSPIHHNSQQGPQYNLQGRYPARGRSPPHGRYPFPLARSPSVSHINHRTPSDTNIRARSKSRSRSSVTCGRCQLPGHHVERCRVRLDYTGRSTYNPNAYCTYHQRPGHTLQECRTYMNSLSGEGERHHHIEDT